MEQQLQQLTFGKALIISVVVAFLYYMLMYNDGTVLEQTIASTNSQIQTQEQEVEKIKVAIADAERYQQTKNALGSELDSVLKAIPEQLSTSDVMKLLSTEAKNLSLNIVTLNGNTTGGGQYNQNSNQAPVFYQTVPVTITLEGTYTNLMLFLSALTKSDKIITAAQLTLENKAANVTDDAGPTLLRLTGEFNAYRYLAPPPQPGATAQ